MDPKIEKILLAGKSSYIYDLAFGHGEYTFIFGGCILDMISKDNKNVNKDIDVVSFYTKDISKRFPKDKDIDLRDFSEYVEIINKHGISMTNSLLYSTSGIHHVSEISNISKDINYKFDDPIGEREWTVNKLKNKEICLWSKMRREDFHYFKDWKIIDPVECAKHGIFTKI